MSHGVTRGTFCHVVIVTPSIQGHTGEVFELNVGDAPQAGLLSVDVSLSLDPPNTFTMVFAQTQFESAPWSEKIPQYSLVFIEMGSEGHLDGSDPTVMVGITGAPVESEHWGEGGPQRTITIGGRGIEAVLWDAAVWFAPFLEDHPELDAGALKWISGPFREQLTGRMIWAQRIYAKNIDPRQAIIQILIYYLSNHTGGFINLQLPANYLIREMLVPGDYTPAELAGLPLDADHLPRIPRDWTFIGSLLDLPAPLLLPTASLHPQPGAVINLIYRVMDRQTHEFFVQYEAGRRARMIHRAKPFARGTGLTDAPRLEEGQTGFADDAPHLESVHVTSFDVVSRSLRYGIDPIYNVFFVTPGQGAILANASFKAHVGPAVAFRETDRAFIGRWGVRPLEYVSPYLVVSQEGTVDNRFLQRMSTAMNRMLYAWYEPHPNMRGGTLGMVGRAEFRPGKRLVWHGREYEGGPPDGRQTLEFYITGVRHRYDYARGAFRSDVQVTRGWPVREVLGDWIPADDTMRSA